MYLLGKNSIIYNPSKDIMQLYGKFYEVTSSGEDNVVVYEDETVIRTTDSKFLKIADRKYLIIDPLIQTKDGNLNTKNYLIVELDKMGNATLFNNEVNLKTFEPTTIITSNYTFDIANEQLIIGGQIVDLKKIIGSTNEYTKPEENIGNNEDDNSSNDNSSNNNTSGNNQNDSSNQGQNNGSNQEVVDDIIDSTKTTSIISVNPSINNISIDYVIYDPLDEYESVFVEVTDSNNKLFSVGYFDKNNTNFIITGLHSNMNYKLTFKYVYYSGGVRIEEVFDETTVTMGKPNISVKIDKVSNDTIYYTVYLDENYSLDSLKVNLTSEIDSTNSINNSNQFNKQELLNKSSVSGSFNYKDIGEFVTLYLSDVYFNGYKIDITSKCKIKVK